MAEDLKMDVQDDFVPEDRLPALVLDPEETPFADGTEITGDTPNLIMVEQIKAFLQYAYDAHGLLLKEREIWLIEEPELTKIAEGLLEYVNGTAPQFMRNAIKVVDMTGGVGQFLWSYGTRIYLTYQAKEDKKKDQIQTMEDPIYATTSADAEQSSRTSKYFIP